jgi:hypothetical protein
VRSLALEELTRQCKGQFQEGSQVYASSLGESHVKAVLFRKATKKDGLPPHLRNKEILLEPKLLL